jgi:hypothetical protein
MGFSSYGEHWRNLRRLTTIELFSASRVASFSDIRKEEDRISPSVKLFNGVVLSSLQP